MDAGQHWDYVLDPARNIGSNVGSTPLFANGPVLFHSSVAFTAALAGGYAANGLRRSKDGGQTWSIITTRLGTGEDPSGNSYGWGYNGVSDSWKEETVDLSAYAGKKVQV